MSARLDQPKLVLGWGSHEKRDGEPALVSSAAGQMGDTVDLC